MLIKFTDDTELDGIVNTVDEFKMFLIDWSNVL